MFTQKTRSKIRYLISRLNFNVIGNLNACSKLTTIARNWLRGKSGIGIAHELAHQWLGDLITCSSWKDIWMNEGGATWSEAVYIRGGDTSKKDYYPKREQNINYRR